MGDSTSREVATKISLQTVDYINTFSTPGSSDVGT
jgi:hypothetical protein